MEMDLDQINGDGRPSTENPSDEDVDTPTKAPSIEVTPPSEANDKSQGTLKRRTFSLFRKKNRDSTLAPSASDDARASVYSVDSSPSTLPDSTDANSVHSSSSYNQSNTPLLMGTIIKYSTSGLIKKWHSRSFELRENALLLRDPQVTAPPLFSLRADRIFHSPPLFFFFLGHEIACKVNQALKHSQG